MNLTCTMCKYLSAPGRYTIADLATFLTQLVDLSHSPKDSETHFKVVVVTDQFTEVKSLIQRHRLINEALAEELQGPVHALSIVAKSPAQWQTNNTVSPSPTCRGGDGSVPKRNGS